MSGTSIVSLTRTRARHVGARTSRAGRLSRDPGVASPSVPKTIVADAAFWEQHHRKLSRLSGLNDVVFGNFDLCGDRHLIRGEIQFSVARLKISSSFLIISHGNNVTKGSVPLNIFRCLDMMDRINHVGNFHLGERKR